MDRYRQMANTTPRICKENRTSDQDSISPCDINTWVSRQVMRIKKNYQLEAILSFELTFLYPPWVPEGFFSFARTVNGEQQQQQQQTLFYPTGY